MVQAAARVHARPPGRHLGDGAVTDLEAAQRVVGVLGDGGDSEHVVEPTCPACEPAAAGADRVRAWHDAPMSTPRLPDRHVVITGAAGGLGPVAAATAVREGASVTLVDTSAERLLAVVDALPAASVRGTAVVDLLDPEAATSFAAGLDEVDAVWHLVGGWRGGTPFEEAPLEDWSLLHDLAVARPCTWRAPSPPLLASPRPFVSVSAPVTAHPSGSGGLRGHEAASDTVVLAPPTGSKSRRPRPTSSWCPRSSPRRCARPTPTSRRERPSGRGSRAALVFVSSDVARTMNGQKLRLVGSGV
jgi:NAD(P)-dependent dehydrogenase (short-subunit alcohol dehydrogenase family)